MSCRLTIVPVVRAWLLLTGLLLWGAANPLAAADRDLATHHALIAQAEMFLDDLDAGEFDAAWTVTSPIFRSLHERYGWEERHRSVRLAYGHLISRRYLRLAHRTTYTLSPDGDYTIIQFASRFQFKDDTVETIVFSCQDGARCTIREYTIR